MMSSPQASVNGDLFAISVECATDALIYILNHKGWVRREELAQRLHVSVRTIRDAASHANGEILSGSRGLKLTRQASADEVNDALGRLRSQVREMQRRLLETERVYHSR